MYLFFGLELSAALQLQPVNDGLGDKVLKHQCDGKARVRASLEERLVDAFHGFTKAYLNVIIGDLMPLNEFAGRGMSLSVRVGSGR